MSLGKGAPRWPQGTQRMVSTLTMSCLGLIQKKRKLGAVVKLAGEESSNSLGEPAGL